jgi:hypothetical protein
MIRAAGTVPAEQYMEATQVKVVTLLLLNVWVEQSLLLSSLPHRFQHRLSSFSISTTMTSQHLFGSLFSTTALPIKL